MEAENSGCYPGAQNTKGSHPHAIAQSKDHLQSPSTTAMAARLSSFINVSREMISAARDRERKSSIFGVVGAGGGNKESPRRQPSSLVPSSFHKKSMSVVLQGAKG